MLMRSHRWPLWQVCLLVVMVSIGVAGCASSSPTSTLVPTASPTRPAPSRTLTTFSLGSVVASAITTDAQSNLWFASSDAVGRVTPTGAVTSYPITSGETTVGDIAYGPDGNLWFTEEAGIGRMTPSGTFTTFALPSADYPGSIVAGPDGNLWFTLNATGGAKVGRISPTGSVALFGPLPADTLLTDIAAGPDGNLWFTEGQGNVNPLRDNIGRITPSGTITEFPLSSGSQQRLGPLSITLGPDGNLWFTEYTARGIGTITPQGHITTHPGPGEGCPAAIAATSDGILWFTTNDCSDVQRGFDTIWSITPASASTAHVLPADSAPYLIAAAPDGSLWLSLGGSTGGIGRFA